MTKKNVFTGKNILQSHTDVLLPEEVFAVYNRIRDDVQLAEETDRLRKIAQVDVKAYARVKTRLPYLCCSEFRDGIRRSENFILSSFFILDLDKIPAEATLQEIKARVIRDPAVILCYVSPGGKGLKLLFELKEPCTSLKEYSDFYKIFSYRFGEMYGLREYIDFSTCDATRVSFLSHDNEAWYEPLNEPVDFKIFLPTVAEAPNPFTTELETASSERKEKDRSELEEEVYQDIRRKLNPDARFFTKKKQIFVPDLLNSLVEPVTAAAVRVGLFIREVRDIHYGKKFVFTIGLAYGEVNLFYGNKGFSVVRTPKSGSDPKVAELGEMVIRQTLADIRYKVPATEKVTFQFN